MEIKRKKIENKLLEKDDFFLDIETTGFSPEYSNISIIGYITYQDGAFYSTQLFSKTANDKKILEEFLEELDKGHRLITFNGQNFDIPFINKRLKRNKIPYEINNENLDLYKYMKKNQVFSPYPAVGQKKLEVMLGLERESDLDGKKAVDLYKKYLNNRDSKIADELLYYNYLDIYNLSLLVEIYYIIRDNKKIISLDKDFYLDSLKINKDKLFIYLENTYKLPYSLEFTGSNYKLEWTDDFKLSLDLITGLIDANTEGRVYHNTNNFDLKDMSIYSLKNSLLLIKDEDYSLENIKSITKEILASSLKDYIGDMK